MCRLVNISVLATFLRNFPLTYLKDEERRIVCGFTDYIVHLENETFSETRLF